jgi:polysaccharide biosynthesis transport protein
MNDVSGSTAPQARPTGGRLVSVPQAAPVVSSGYGYGPGYGYDHGYGTPDESEIRTRIFEYWPIIYKRKWLIASVIAACVAIGALTTLMKTPLYTSSARLQIDPSAPKVLKGGDVSSENNYGWKFIKTQHELLLGGAIAERVASALKLGEDADFFKSREFSVMGAIRGLLAAKGPSDGHATSNREGAAVGIILANRAVRPVPRSRLVDVIYSDPDPARAQRIADAIADAFINLNIDKRFQANSYAKVFLEDQAKQLKLRLEQSEQALLAFGQKEQIVAVTEKSSIADNNLASANATLGNLASERIKNEELWKQAEAAKVVNLPQFLTNAVVDGLRAKRKELETEYQEKLEIFKPSYPAMVQVSNKIVEIDRQMASEINAIKSALKAGYESSINQENEMKKRIGILREEVFDLQKRSIEYNILKREVDTNRTLYDGLLKRYKEVDIAGGVGASNIFVVEKAGLPGAPSSPQMSRALSIWLAIGVVGGVGAAVLLDRLDDTIRTADELERTSGFATLGIIPKTNGEGLAAELGDPRSHISEACRSLCTSLQFATDTGLPKTIAVTSSGPGDGKSTTAMMIGRHFATMGLKVLLVDGDLRKPSLHLKLGLDNGAGLSNYLTGAATPLEVLQSTGTHNLFFLASGPLPPNAADLLGSAKMHSLLSVGNEVFDLIIIDGPPVMGLADAPLLSSAVAGTIFVAAAGQVRTGHIRNALQRLRFARGSVIGTVLTKFDVKLDTGYGSGYYQGYYQDKNENGTATDEPVRANRKLDRLLKHVAKLTTATAYSEGTVRPRLWREELGPLRSKATSRSPSCFPARATSWSAPGAVPRSPWAVARCISAPTPA